MQPQTSMIRSHSEHGATRHRPTDRDTLRAAAVELAARGLTPRDIGIALRLSEAAVQELVSACAPARSSNVSLMSR